MSNMVVNTNVLALNSHRALKGVGNIQSKASEKLSSGLRINRAADDAAGLAISEKMRSQIRGLDQASRNSLDGISLIQTAEGALQETENMLQRMRELTVQAANDILEPSDRQKIALELDQLSEEIDATAEKTEFNKKKLIDGSWKEASIYFQTGANEGQGLSFNIDAMNASVLGVTKPSIGGVVASTAGGATPGTKLFSATSAIFEKGDDGTAQATLDFSNAEELKRNVGIYRINSQTYFEVLADGKIALTGFNSVKDGTIVDPSKITSANDSYTALAHPFVANGSEAKLTFTVGANGKPGTMTYATATGVINGRGTNQAGPTSVGASTEYSFGNGNVITMIGGANSSGAFAATAVKLVFSGSGNVYAMNGTKPVEIQKGKEYTSKELKELFGDPATNKAIVVIDGMSAEITFGVGNTSPSIAQGVHATVKGGGAGSGKIISKVTTVIDNAIEKVSSQRAKLGAYQNRLEHTIKNLDVASENLSASESRIRDTDMAKEMMNVTKANVLSQAATSMLAQANQNTQNILQLLR